MADTPESPLVLVATIAGGLAAMAVASRGVAAVGRFALQELDYRAGYRIDDWLRSLR